MRRLIKKEKRKKAKGKKLKKWIKEGAIKE